MPNCNIVMAAPKKQRVERVTVGVCVRVCLCVVTLIVLFFQNRI